MELQGFHLVDGKYQEIQVTTDGRLWSQQLELYLGVYEGKLRFFTTENQLILSSEELAEQERLRAQQAEKRAQEFRRTRPTSRARTCSIAGGITHTGHRVREYLMTSGN